ncbi:MAG: hypothetical protein OEY14_09615, partial [Myxococcales bacterium]|nr:hypothetical protein [Myxococcales bacterium]
MTSPVAILCWDERGVILEGGQAAIKDMEGTRRAPPARAICLGWSDIVHVEEGKRIWIRAQLEGRIRILHVRRVPGEHALAFYEAVRDQAPDALDPQLLRRLPGHDAGPDAAGLVSEAPEFLDWDGIGLRLNAKSFLRIEVRWSEVVAVHVSPLCPDFRLRWRAPSGVIDERRCSARGLHLGHWSPEEERRYRATVTFLDVVRERVPAALKEQGWSARPPIHWEHVSHWPGEHEAGGSYRDSAKPAIELLAVDELSALDTLLRPGLELLAKWWDPASGGGTRLMLAPLQMALTQAFVYGEHPN